MRMVKLPSVFFDTMSASTSMPLVKARWLPQVENFHSSLRSVDFRGAGGNGCERGHYRDRGGAVI